MAIDFHTHVIPPALPDWHAQFSGGRWPRLLPQDDGSAMLAMGDTTLMRLDDRFWSPQRRFVDMQKQRIDTQVVSPIPLLACYRADARANRQVARFLNGHIAELVAVHPDRFVGMGTVPLQDPALAVEELRHCRDTLGIRSVQIGTCPAGRDLDDPALFPFFEAAQDLGVAVFVHPIEPLIGRDRMNDYYLPNIVGNPLETGLAAARLICGGVLERLPGLKICLAHGGGALAAILGRLDKGFAVRSEMRQHITRPPSEYARMVYVDALTFDPSGVRTAVEKHGVEHVLLGTDYPFLLGDIDPRASLAQAGLGAEAERRIGEANIREFIDR